MKFYFKGDVIGENRSDERLVLNFSEDTKASDYCEVFKVYKSIFLSLFILCDLIEFYYQLFYVVRLNLTQVFPKLSIIL